MFTDIEGFTTLSERLPPAEVASILNTYLGTVVPVIQRHGGVVNSFIGDGLFASFNLPLPLEHHAAAAIQAGARDPAGCSAGATFPPGRRLRTRIGINTGTGDRRHDRRREPAELHPAGRRGEHRLAGRAAQQAVRHRHPRDREHGARGRATASPACGWARPTCAAIAATSWSTASGRRHDARPPAEIAGDAPALSLDGDVDLLPRSRDHRDLHGRRRVVDQSVALRRHRRACCCSASTGCSPAGCSSRSGTSSRATHPSRASSAASPSFPCSPRRGVARPGLRRRRRSGCRLPVGSIRTVRLLPGRPSPTSSPTCIVLTVFYFTYTYFVVSDYLAEPLHLHLRALRPQSQPVLRQLHAEAHRGAAGDLDRAAGGDRRRPVLLRRRAPAGRDPGRCRVAA